MKSCKSESFPVAASDARAGPFVVCELNSQNASESLSEQYWD